MSIDFIPAGDFIVVKDAVETLQKMKGVILPESYKGPISEAEVVAVGPGYHHPASGLLIPLEANVGDTIVYNREVQFVPYAESDVQYKIIRIAAVLGYKRKGKNVSMHRMSC